MRGMGKCFVWLNYIAIWQIPIVDYIFANMETYRMFKNQLTIEKKPQQLSERSNEKIELLRTVNRFFHGFDSRNGRMTFISTTFEFRAHFSIINSVISSKHAHKFYLFDPIFIAWFEHVSIFISKMSQLIN